jgi:chemotaxis protein histidine kinase CheA
LKRLLRLKPSHRLSTSQRVQTAGRRSYDKPDNVSSLRVPAAKLDQFVDLVGELVTVQARLSELAARRDDPESPLSPKRLSGSLRPCAKTP